MIETHGVREKDWEKKSGKSVLATVAFKVISPTLSAFPEEVAEREKGDFRRDSSHFGTGSFLPKNCIKTTSTWLSIYLPFSKSTFPDVFYPSLHEGNSYQAFNDYIEAWEMSYDVAWIVEMKDDASELVQQQHKAKVFRMCVFQGERLKTDLKSEFNQDFAQLKQVDFNTMLQRLCNRYRPTQNQVLFHYQFHGLRQEPGEKIHSFFDKVRQHVDKCSFKYSNLYDTEKEKNT